MKMTNLQFGGPYSTTFGGGRYSLSGWVEFDLTRSFLVLGIGSVPHRFIGHPRPANRQPRTEVFLMYCDPSGGRLLLGCVASPVAEVRHVDAVARRLTESDLVGLLPQEDTFDGLATFVGRTLLFFIVRACSSDPAVSAGASAALAAALRARNAILESAGTDDWKRDIVSFARTYLGIARTDADWLEAVSTALLGDWVDALAAGPPADDGELHHLRREARAVHRELMPLWQRKSGPGRVWMLDYRFPSGETLHDVIGGSYRIEDEALAWSPDRPDACAVFGWLKEDEQRIARAFALGGGSWAEAAAAAGMAPEAGERVMRKLRRLGLQYRQRRAAIAGAA